MVVYKTFATFFREHTAQRWGWVIKKFVALTRLGTVSFVAQNVFSFSLEYKLKAVNGIKYVR